MPMLSLPSPKRTVRRGIGVCRRMGYTDDQALGVIMSVCSAAAGKDIGPNDLDLTWLSDVYEEARCQRDRLRQRQ